MNGASFQRAPRSNLFGLPVGVRMRGGCMDCDADHELIRDDPELDVWCLRIYHDNSCPFYRKKQRGGRQ